jgi:hypothetical protein
MTELFVQLPIFVKEKNNTGNEGIDFNYSLYEHPFNTKIQAVTQPKLLLIVLKAI